MCGRGSAARTGVGLALSFAAASLAARATSAGVGELSRGLVSWTATYAERLHKLASLRRSMAHLVNRELSRGFGAWLEMAERRSCALAYLLNRGRIVVSLAGWDRIRRGS